MKGEQAQDKMHIVFSDSLLPRSPLFGEQI